MKRVFKIIMAAAAVAVLTLLPTHSTHATSLRTNDSRVSWRAHGVCFTTHNIPVTLAEGQPNSQTISGTYCQPYRWDKSRQVDVLVPGATYTSSYWNWPQNPSLYSYVDNTLEAKRAIFTYDHLGSGKSSHPASTLVTMDAEAHILHQFIQALKLLGLKQINLIGHSYGSGIALHETAIHNDATRLVLTGYLHTPRNPIVADATYPANQDPTFQGQNLDNGYLTTKPNTRINSFYYAPTANPDVVAYDEAHKDLVTATGFGGFFGDRAVPAGSNLSNQITLPTLLINGERDFIFCFDPNFLDCTNQPQVKAHETPYFTNTPSMEVVMVKDTGHNLPLHPSATTSFNSIDQWIKTH